MMLNSKVTVLIDGNNLAHFLYTNLVPGTKMTDEMVELLANHLINYARAYSDLVNVELILDRMPKKQIKIQTNNLWALYADPPQTGDDVLLGQFLLYHQIHREPCLVISNDEALLDEIKSEGGIFLRVSDFVRRPGKINPVFVEPKDFPKINLPPENDTKQSKYYPLRSSIFYRMAKEQVERTNLEEKPDQDAGRNTVQPIGINHQDVVIIPVFQDNAEGDTSTLNSMETFASIPSFNLTAQSQNVHSRFSYAINFDTWPLTEGARFLRGAFCETHRAEYQDLLNSVNYASLHPADLRAIAELLRYACGQEADFSRRGSLIDRIRLALLKSHSSRVSLAELAQQTGLNPVGLHRKIKEKAGRWIKIIPEPARIE